MPQLRKKIQLPIDLSSIQWMTVRQGAGLAGFGMAWVLLNRLAGAPGHKLPLSLLPAICEEFQFDQHCMDVMVIHAGIFASDDHRFWYPEMLPKERPAEPLLPVADAVAYSPEQQESFRKFEAWLKQNCARVCQMQKQMSIGEYLKVVATIDRKQLIKTLADMENWKPLLSKRVSVYLTILNWNREKR